MCKVSVRLLDVAGREIRKEVAKEAEDGQVCNVTSLFAVSYFPPVVFNYNMSNVFVSIPLSFFCLQTEFVLCL